MSSKLPVRNVESHRVDSIFVTLKSVKEFTSLGLPYFAGSIVTASDESRVKNKLLVSVFVKAAVGEGKDMAFEGFEEFKVLLLFF